MKTPVKNKIFIALIALALIIFIGIFYLNEVILPQKIQALLVKGIEDATGKKVVLGSLKFNIFKGLVLRDLIVYDDKIAILNAKETSCVFFILPVFKKEILIPCIRVESPEIFVERKADGSLNIKNLLKVSSLAGRDFRVIVRHVAVRGARLVFHDNALTPSFRAEARDINLNVLLALPATARFDLAFEMPTGADMTVDSSGEYLIREKEFSGKVRIKGLQPKVFSRYYENFKFSFPDGTADIMMNITVKGKAMALEASAETKGLTYSKDALLAKIDSAINATAEYNFFDKTLRYAGDADIGNMSISGVEPLGLIEDIKGIIKFTESGLSSDNMSAKILGLPAQARVNMVTSALNIYIASDVKLAVLQEILKNKFNIALPVQMDGQGKLNVAAQYQVPIAVEPQSSGSLDMTGATMSISKTMPPLEDVTGSFKFQNNQLSWADMDFRYRDTDYRTSGTLVNFDNPGVTMTLSSKDIFLESVMALNGKKILFSKLDGRYKKSEFSVNGELDTAGLPDMNADIKGVLDVDLEDIKEPLKKFQEKLDKIKPSGKARIELGLKGNLSELKYCAIDAKLFSDSLSLYGFKPVDLIVDYDQADGVASIARAHSFLYGGTIDASGKMDLTSNDLPYHFEAAIKGVRIERLKEDTAFKDKDIGGAIDANFSVDGFSGDSSRLTGAGKINISDGNLWQLNLFQGLGVLLFTSDFSNVLFREGNLSFVIKDKYAFTEDLRMRSDLIDITGSVKTGFDNTINASLKGEFTEQGLGMSRAKKISAAMEKYLLIGINGTLKNPKYSINPDMGSILQDIKDAIFQN